MVNILFDIYKDPLILLYYTDNDDHIFPGIYPETWTEDIECLKNPFDIVIDKPLIHVTCCKRHIWSITAINSYLGLTRHELVMELCIRYRELHPQRPTVKQRARYICGVLCDNNNPLLYYIRLCQY